MSKILSRIIACFMLGIAAGFTAFAMTHPEASFPWSNTVTFALYAVWLAVTVVLLIAPFGKQ